MAPMIIPGACVFALVGRALACKNGKAQGCSFMFSRGNDKTLWKNGNNSDDGCRYGHGPDNDCTIGKAWSCPCPCIGHAPCVCLTEDQASNARAASVPGRLWGIISFTACSIGFSACLCGWIYYFIRCYAPECKDWAVEMGTLACGRGRTNDATPAWPAGTQYHEHGGPKRDCGWVCAGITLRVIPLVIGAGISGLLILVVNALVSYIDETFINNDYHTHQGC